MKWYFSVFILLSFSSLTAQSFSIEDYIFVSKNNDSIAAELGTFKVIEDRSGQAKDSIQLSFVRFKSTNPQPGPPIVYLSGGPGGSATGTAEGSRFELFMKLREVADVIAFDQRGTGLSHRLPRCPYSAEFELTKALEKKEYVRKSTKNIQQCLSFFEKEKVNIKAYNTTESAKDIDALRQVLEAKKISIWGISYGSHLAFEYIRLFENRIYKMVLASIEGPNETIKQPKNTEAFLFKLADLAKCNYGSPKTYPNLKEKIIKVHQRLEDKPVMTSYKDRDGKTVAVAVSNFELQSAIATFYLKNPNDSKELPRIYNEMYKGNFQDVAVNIMVLKKYIYNRIRPMAFSMDMQSGISEQRKEVIKEQIDNSILGSTINFLLFEWMNALDYPMLPDQFRKMKANQVNALLLSGTLDGRTYLKPAKAIAEKFQKGRHVILKNAGHDLYMSSPLIGELVLNFFQDKELRVDSIEISPTYFD